MKMQKIIFPLLILILLLFPKDISARWKTPNEITVYLQAESKDTGNASVPFFSELRSYLMYYLEESGYTVHIRDGEMTPIPNNDSSAVQYALQVSTAYRPNEYTRIDHHRRRFRDTSDSLFSIRLSLFDISKSTTDQAIAVVEESGRQNWLSRTRDRGEVNRMRRMTEPREFVIQRAVEKVLHTFPRFDLFPTEHARQIPLHWYVDSSFIKEHGASWMNQLRRLHQLTDRRLGQQISVSLVNKQVETVRLLSEEAATPAETLRNFKSILPPQQDEIAVFLFSRQTVADYFLDTRAETVGLTEIGQRVIVINDVPLPKENRSWQAYYTSHILLHEIGHTFGAVHVSDLSSVMNHTVTVTADGRFDRLNRSIILSAINGTLNFTSFSEYVELVIASLSKTGYTLADIPYFAYHFLYKNDLYKKNKTFYSQPQYRPYYLAASGYHYLINGNRSKAAELFSDAVELLPRQGSFHYYRSQASTEATVREKSLSIAARAGYYMAKVKKQMRHAEPE